ncbi:MAG: hypothetical protein ABIF71_03735 [Planctomycetota bacterium]
MKRMMTLAAGIAMFWAAGCGRPAGPVTPPPPVVQPAPVAPTPAVTPPAPAPVPPPAPKAEVRSFTPTADTTIHLYTEERKQSVGGRDYLRAKGGEDTALMRFDLAPLKGRKIEKAALHLTIQRENLRILGISTVPVAWNEGTSTNYAVEPGAAQYYSPVGADSVFWGADNTSDFYSVTFGLGGSFWFRSEVEPAGENTVKADLNPDLVYALACGDADSLAVYDGSGQTRTNNSVFSREAGAKGPRLEVTFTDETDSTPPGAPGTPVCTTAGLAEGELLVRFAPAADQGFDAQAFGYEVFWSEQPVTDPAAATAVPRIRVPHYPESDGNYLVFVQGLPVGRTVHVVVRGYDAAGNRGPLAAAACDMPSQPFAPLADGKDIPQGRMAATPAVVTVGGLSVYAVPGIVRIDPMTGLPMDKQPGDARCGNSVWDGPTKSVRLVSAREEVVDFQFSLTAAEHVKLFTVWCVNTGKPDQPVWTPEVCVPQNGPFDLPIAANAVPGQKALAVWADIWVPANATPGDYTGTVTVAAAGASQAIPLGLRVLPLTLPARPTHVNEVHTYSNTVNEGAKVKQLGGRHKAQAHPAGRALLRVLCHRHARPCGG